MKLPAALSAAAFLVLTACGAQDRTEQTADRLEEAAEQSGPAAAQVLENAAEEVREQEQVAPLSAPNSTAQEALEAAGDAQARTVQPQDAPPSLQAQPNRTGQQTPPPKLDTTNTSR